MLKARLIPILLLKNERMVKPIQFGAGGERDVGWPVTTAKIYNSQDADELVFLDVNATNSGRSFLLDTLKKVAEHCFVPLTAGGGIKTTEDIREILRAGADKVSINTVAMENPNFIRESADIFGRQCIIVSIDALEVEHGKYVVCTHGGKTKTNRDVVEWAKEVAKFGAGEILLTSIDREGTMKGYDINLVRSVADAVSIPVIANGGAGNRAHFVDVIREGHASAVAASSVFHFSDSNIPQVKLFINNSSIPIRC